MSTSDFKTILSTLEKFPFFYSFGEVTTGKVDKDKTFTSSQLKVEYGDGKGKFSFPVEFTQSTDKRDIEMNKQNQQLLKVLESNVTAGNIPDELKKASESINVPEKEDKLFKVTDKVIYFDKETNEVLKVDIDLTNDTTGTGKKVIVPKIDGFEFVKHEKFGVGFSMIYDGFLISCQTEENKTSLEKNPLKFFIEKFLSFRPEDRGELFSKVMKNCKENKKRILEGRERSKKPVKYTQTQPNPVKPSQTTGNGVKSNPTGKTDPTPTKPTNPVKPSKLTQRPLISRVKGDDIDLWDSWGGGNIKKGTDTNKNPFVTFTVKGFLFQGIVKVMDDLKTGLYVITIHKDSVNSEPVKRVEKVTIEKLPLWIDSLVEFPNDDNLYGIMVQQMERDIQDKQDELKKEVSQESKPVVKSKSKSIGKLSVVK